MVKRGLIVVDMLVDFCKPDGVLYCGPTVEPIVKGIADILSDFRAAHDAVFYLADAHAEDDKEFALFPRHCVKGTPGALVIPELAPRAGEAVIEKRRYSGFYGTDLEERLSEAGVEEVHVCGVCTSICVMDTVSGLRDRDIPTVVHANAVADFDQEAHAFALKRIEKILGAKVVNGGDS